MLSRARLVVVVAMLVGCSRNAPIEPTPASIRGAIGIHARMVRLPDADGYTLNGRRFIQITRVASGSSAAQAGIKVGDELAEIDGETVHSTAFAIDRIAAAPPGTSLRLGLRRAGTDLELTVPVMSRGDAFPDTKAGD